MAENSSNSSEEIDLGKLFQLIGNGIKSFFNGILNIFKWIFHNIILILIFFKKHALIFAVAILVGAVIGYFLDLDKKPNYKSVMVVETNFGSGHRLYNQLEYINSLIGEKDSITLSGLFNVPSNKVLSLKKLKAQPYESEKNLKVEYDYYIKHTDTIYTFARNFTINDFKERLSEPDYRLQEITAVFDKPDLFKGLKQGILDLVKNDYYQNKYKIKNKELQVRKRTIEKDLAQIDSLRELYKNVALLKAKNNSTPNTSIDLSGKGKQSNLDIDLFNQRRYLLEQLQKLNKEIQRTDFIIKVITDFNKGVEVKSFLSKKWILGALISFFMVLFFILILKINNFLDNYTKQ